MIGWMISHDFPFCGCKLESLSSQFLGWTRCFSQRPGLVVGPWVLPSAVGRRYWAAFGEIHKGCLELPIQKSGSLGGIIVDICRPRVQASEDFRGGLWSQLGGTFPRPQNLPETPQRLLRSLRHVQDRKTRRKMANSHSSHMEVIRMVCRCGDYSKVTWCTILYNDNNWRTFQSIIYTSSIRKKQMKYDELELDERSMLPEKHRWFVCFNLASISFQTPVSPADKLDLPYGLDCRLTVDPQYGRAQQSLRTVLMVCVTKYVVLIFRGFINTLHKESICSIH